jgi:hypothetical protein
MLLRALKDHHYALYQTVLALVGLTAVLHILCDYKWSTALGYAAVTLLSYWGGQGLVTLLQRGRAPRSRGSFD